MVKSCGADIDCPGAWECDKVAEHCVRTEPADFFWSFLMTSSFTAAIVIVVVLLLFNKTTEPTTKHERAAKLQRRKDSNQL